MEFLEANEGAVRLCVFIGVFALMAGLETLFPRKERALPRFRRWLTNSLLVVVDTVALRVLVPVLAAGMAAIAARHGWGLFNLLGAPLWVEIALAVALLDLSVYAQHVATHKIPILWRLHKVHHADRDIDVTTGVRFHPVEIVLSMAYKLVVVIVLGPAVVAVILFEVILNASAMFNHANVKLPLGLDRALRMGIVTPDMHRVHHSVLRKETDANYGFFLSIWDRLFGTYIAQPESGHDGVTIGLPDYQTDKPGELLWSLALPFQPQKAPVDQAGVRGQ